MPRKKPRDASAQRRAIPFACYVAPGRSRFLEGRSKRSIDHVARVAAEPYPLLERRRRDADGPARSPDAAAAPHGLQKRLGRYLIHVSA